MPDLNLQDIYHIIRENPGWLSDCREAGYSDEELAELERIDAREGFDTLKFKWDGFRWAKTVERHPNREIEEWEKVVNRFGGPDIHFLETDEEKIRALSKRISHFYDRARDLFSGRWTYADLILITCRIKETERMRAKITARLYHKDDNAFLVSEDSIVRARAVPLETVIGTGLKQSRMPCPFHNGKDLNFKVNNGFGYCFVCNEWCDSIKWVMRFNGLKFHDAVRHLNRI